MESQPTPCTQHDRGPTLRTAQALSAEQQIGNSPELGQRLICDVLEDRARKQINATGVAVEAIEAIKMLPPLSPSSSSQPDQPEIEKIDEDWMNQFVRYAEDASSEQLQQVWGRVLAGEIVKPGSFSRHTLRFFAELDKETAKNCEIIGHNSIKGWILKDESWDKGDKYMISVELQHLGIMEGGSIGGPEQTFTVNDQGNCGIVGKSWGLYLAGKPGTNFSFPVYVLTRLGREVMSILNVSDEEQTLRRISNSINKAGIKNIQLGQVIPISENQVQFTPNTMKIIWQSTE